MTVTELGYHYKQYSTWEGDKGKFFLATKEGTSIGIVNTNDNTICPTHGYYGGYLTQIAKKLNLTLIGDYPKR